MTSSSLTLIHHFLEGSADQYPDKVALIHNDTRASYNQINTMANSLALRLQKEGCGHGTRVVILQENSLTYVVSYYAILKAGGVAVPLSPDSKAHWLAKRIHELDAKILIATSRYERFVFSSDTGAPPLKTLIIKDSTSTWEKPGIPPRPWEHLVTDRTRDNLELSIGKNDLACIIYTSGSTGTPKGVMLTHENIVTNTQSICQYLALSEGDIQMVVLPFHYVMGKSLLNTHFAVGGTIVVNNGFAYPAQVVQQMIDEKVTSFSGVPSTYAWLLNRSPLKQKAPGMTSLRYCSQAGGHMSAKLKRELVAALPPHTDIVIMYGATEASSRLSYLPPEKYTEKMGSIGKAIPGVTLSIVDEQGREVKEGETGELIASGPNIMSGYWKDIAASRQVLSKKGYHTGDLCWRDNEGFLYLMGRKDSLIKIGGHRVNPTEIEDLIMETGVLIEAVVLSIEDEFLGNKLVAAVVPKDNEQTHISVVKACARLVPRSSLPGEIKLVSNLPKNESGKIIRKKCLEMFAPINTSHSRTALSTATQKDKHHE